MADAYSRNLIFFDTEFSSLDTDKGEIISLGMVKASGEELYLEIEYDGGVDEWPRNNILPGLVKEKVSKAKAVELIEEFVGEGRSYVVAYINQFDMIYLYKLFGLDHFNDRFNWIPIDFASILFSKGIDPEILAERKKEFYDGLGIDLSEYVQHNALEDARLLKDTYLKLASKSS